MDAFSAADYMRTTALPLTTVGAHNANVGAKYEAVMASLKLDAAWLGFKYQVRANHRT